MKVSTTWLQRYFEKPLPGAAELAEAFTFHAFEVESIEGDVLDLKVLTDRAGYALSHRGIAKELSAILDIPLKSDPLREPLPTWPTTDKLVIRADTDYVRRHTGTLVKGVKVGPSPAWLRELLESVGQRSINNIVDVLNFVMLDIGQPAGAFDAGKMKKDKGVVKIDIQRAKKGDKITVLTGEEYVLTEDMFAFTDGTGGALLDIAGIKGGLSSGVTEQTSELFISVGNYDATLLRRVSQKLKLATDASQRYQNRPSPELTAYGMRDILALIQEVAGGELVGVVDVYNTKPEQKNVSITSAKVSSVLGAEYSNQEVENVLSRLGLSYKTVQDTYIVTPPFERTDINIPEDLVEEVGRVIGYDRVAPNEFDSIEEKPFSGRRKVIEAIRELMVAEGYTEASTYSMVEKGDLELAKPLADDKKFLRTNLALGHQGAAALNNTNLPLFNVPDLRMFEIGHVWPKGQEKFVLGITYSVGGKGAEKKIQDEFTRMHGKLEALVEKKVKAETSGNTIQFDMHELGDTKATPPLTMTQLKLSAYHPFSIYPFVLRDIALWVPIATGADSPQPATDMIYHITSLIRENAGPLLLRCDLFDTFSKDGKTSYAYRLVFQSPDRTLSDAEVNVIMDSVTSALNAKPGWKVR